VTPLVVPWLALTYGWQEAFIVTGAVGFIWLVFWLIIYRKPEDYTRLSKAELAYIRSDPAESTEKIPWSRLLPHRQTWAFAIGKFLTDPIWWVYLFWLPDFLDKRHGLDLKTFGIPVAVIYIIADVGSVGGGWISSSLIKRGWTINKGRKTAMLICALAVVPIVFAAQTSSLWISVLLIGLAAAAHQGWSANLFTLTSDMFPRRAVGSVVGIGGMAGAIGGMFISIVVGRILQATGSYVPIFIIAGCTYLVALLIIHLLVPNLDPANLDDPNAEAVS
jgi:ACS family hexuronate transporter-like MFS transporter